MKKSLLWNAAVIVVVIALTATATWAYFGNTEQHGIKVETASIGVTGISGFDMLFTNLLPGDVQTQTVVIKNTSTVPADFYLQMVAGDPDSTNFCMPNEVIYLKVTQLNGVNTPVVWYNASVCPLFQVYPTPIIPKIGENIPNGWEITYQVDLYLHPSATNAYAGKFNHDKINLIATQWNGDAPVAIYNQIWPAGDPKYAP